MRKEAVWWFGANLAAFVTFGMYNLVWEISQELENSRVSGIGLLGTIMPFIAGAVVDTAFLTYFVGLRRRGLLGQFSKSRSQSPRLRIRC
jgi:hypothetical protein